MNSSYNSGDQKSWAAIEVCTGLLPSGSSRGLSFPCLFPLPGPFPLSSPVGTFSSSNQATRGCVLLMLPSLWFSFLPPSSICKDPVMTLSPTGSSRVLSHFQARSAAIVICLRRSCLPCKVTTHLQVLGIRTGTSCRGHCPARHSMEEGGDECHVGRGTVLCEPPRARETKGKRCGGEGTESRMI